MVERIKVSGIAVKPGVSRNNVMYSKEELRKFAPTLKGVSIIKDHNASCDNAIGKVENIIFDEATGNVMYEGWVENDATNISEKIKDGRVQHVSIGALAGRMVKESEDCSYNTAEDLTGVELSTVIVPGVPGASIQHSYDEYTEESLKEMIEAAKTKCPKCNKMVVMVDGECPECEDEEDDMEESSHIKNSERGINKMENTNEKIVQETEVAKQETIVEKSAEVIALESKLKTAEETIKALEENLKVANEKLALIEENKRLEAVKQYTEMAKAKGLNAVDASKMAIEMIKTLMEAIKDVKVVEEKKEEVKVKEAVKEEVKVVEEVKEVAVPKSAVVAEAKVESKDMSKYVIEKSTLGGSCFYKIN